MSMVHPATLMANRRVDDAGRANEEVRRYVATEYRGRHAGWLASILSAKRTTEKAKVERIPRDVMPDTGARADGKSCCPVMRALSESNHPRGDATGER